MPCFASAAKVEPKKPLCDAKAECTKLCDGGNAAACTLLGEQTRSDDYPAMKAAFEKGCNGGDMAGCRGLAWMISGGKASTKDEAKANELYAKGDRKLKPEFLNLVGSAAAVIFTLPKDDTMTGTGRCLKRMGILRGNKITLRYKRLDMVCDRTKTEASIVVRRGLDQ